MTLGTDWKGQKIDGWMVSEKLDGCRAYWDGEQLWTRGGNIIAAPDWFMEGFPKGIHLDGEIFAGRGGFQRASEAVRLGRFVEGVTFEVFDCPSFQAGYESRIGFATTAISKYCHRVNYEKVESMQQVRQVLTRVLSLGGEGLMLRNPRMGIYETGRTANLLKIKLDTIPGFKEEYFAALL